VSSVGNFTKEIAMIDEYIQTDNNNRNSNRGSSLGLNEDSLSDLTSDKYKEYTEKIEKMKCEIETFYKKNLNAITTENEKLNEEIKTKNRILEENKKEIECMKLELENVKKNVEIKDCAIKELETSLKDKQKFAIIAEKLSNAEKNKENDYDSARKLNLEIALTDKIEDIPISLNNLFNQAFSSHKIYKIISSFILPDDKLRLCYASKLANEHISHLEIIRILKRVIERKNDLIKRISKYDISKEYEIADVEIERLMVEYTKLNKTPGMDLRSQLIKASNFLETDVKGPLGISTKHINQNEQNPKKNSFLGK
jgi:hypothetical protein